MCDPSILIEIKANCGRFYVYTLSYPNGSQFYVGYGRAGVLPMERVARHEAEAKAKPRRRHNRHKRNTILAIWRTGASVVVAIESWHDKAETAQRREIELIANIGRRDMGMGPLTNMTAGGEGSPELTGDGLRRRNEGQKRGTVARALWAKENPEAQAAMGRRAGAISAAWMKANPEQARARQSAALVIDLPSGRAGIVPWQDAEKRVLLLANTVPCS